MPATCTFDVFSTLDGYGSYGPDGDWGGYWGKQGPCEYQLSVLPPPLLPSRMPSRTSLRDQQAVSMTAARAGSWMKS